VGDQEVLGAGKIRIWCGEVDAIACTLGGTRVSYQYSSSNRVARATRQTGLQHHKRGRAMLIQWTGMY